MEEQLKGRQNDLHGINRSLRVQTGSPVLTGGMASSEAKTLTARIAGTAGGVVVKNFLADVSTLLESDLIAKGAKKGIAAVDIATPNIESVKRLRALFEAVDPAATNLVDDVLGVTTKTVGKMAGKAFAKGEVKVAAKLGGRYLGAQFAKASGPLNIIGTASMLYDVGKMSAVGVVSAGNFAKEAVKSMQGSMRAPMFGMGYRDNEIAATSRSRGVMAIQNSRLNARSALGSEAGMMAAHFG